MNTCWPFQSPGHQQHLRAFASAFCNPAESLRLPPYMDPASLSRTSLPSLSSGDWGFPVGGNMQLNGSMQSSAAAANLWGSLRLSSVASSSSSSMTDSVAAGQMNDLRSFASALPFPSFSPHYPLVPVFRQQIMPASAASAAAAAAATTSAASSGSGSEQHQSNNSTTRSTVTSSISSSLSSSSSAPHASSSASPSANLTPGSKTTLWRPY